MSNLTITIDDQLLRAARIKAVQQGTSVNEVCRQAIAAFALNDPSLATAQAHARAQAFVELSEQLRLAGEDKARRAAKAKVLPNNIPPSRRTRYPADPKEKAAASMSHGFKR
ncbi:MAG: hypothetical protein HEQ39_02165 [Rhizobacter sp.]